MDATDTKRRRAIAAVEPLPPTPTLVALAVELLDALDTHTQAVDQLGKERVATNIAARIAAHAGSRRCLRVMLENDRVAALRVFVPDPGPAWNGKDGLSVYDVAERIVAIVLGKIAEAQL